MKKVTRGEVRIAMGDPKHCMCGKVAYDKKSAMTAKNSRMKHSHVKLRIYQCPQSDVWHLTSRL